MIDYVPFEDDEKEWVSKEMNEQVKRTVLSINKKSLRDNEKAYIVLGIKAHYTPNKKNKKDPTKVRKQIFHSDTLDVLKRLSAEVLCYLNEDHTRLLLMCPLAKLIDVLENERYASQYFQSVKRLGPLLPKEQISKILQEDSDWVNTSRDIIIQLMPNLSMDKQKEYADILKNYLRQEDANVRSCEGTDYIISKLKKESTTQLLQESNFVFRVSEIPKGIIEKINLPNQRERPYRNRSVRSVASSIESQNTQYDSLPIICVLDSGVNDIPQFNGLLIAKDGYRNFSNFDDDYPPQGHGTPIAYLAAFGENSSIPKARIVSYKIISDKYKDLEPEGYRLSIQKYSNKVYRHYAPIFLSSINFVNYNEVITSEIDKLIQKNNICAIFSSGNIDSKEINDYMSNGIPCKSYIDKHPVLDPSQAVNALSIGAIANKEAPNSLSHENELSPFTRCGIKNNCNLYGCSKPEFVQHGGNLCKDGKHLGVKSFGMDGEQSEDFVGTSFSAPIFAHYLSEIYCKYGGKFSNSETLKAIALALSSGKMNGCMGFGEIRSLSNFKPHLHALICSEGEIPLQDSITKAHYNIEYTSKISIAVPRGVNCIKMFLVHSDNHYREAKLHLNTYLRVKAYKTGRESSSVDLFNPTELDKKSNMKIFVWHFKQQSMEGNWDFFIEPEVTADMLAQHKKETTIRYGCAILVRSKKPSRLLSITQEIRNSIEQKE